MDELSERDIERLRERKHVVNGDAAFAPFDGSDVGAMEAAQVGECLLRVAALESDAAQIGGKFGSCGEGERCGGMAGMAATY